MKGTSVFETAFVLVVLHLVNVAFFPDAPAYLTIHPHPYFAVVVLASLRYARLDSLLSTMLVVATLWLEVHWVGDAVAVAGAASAFKVSVLLVIANLVLGELGSLFYREIHESRERITELEAAHKALKIQYDALQLVKDELSERIVGQTSSILSLYEAAKRLETLDADQIHSALLEITVKFIGAESCSLLLVEPETRRLVLERSYGWTTEEKQQRGKLALGIGEGVLGRVVEENRMLTLKELSDERSLAEAARFAPLPTVLAAPLALDGKVEAVMNVERIPFLKYSPTNIRLFYLIADLGSTALANSRKFQKMKEENIVDPDTGLATPSFMETSIQAELQRFQRTGLAFSVCLMQLDEAAQVGTDLGEKLERMEGEVARLALGSKREIDVAARLPTGEWAFVLPITEVEGALVFCRKIQQRVLAKIKVKYRDGVDRRLTASFGVTTAHGRGLTRETVLARARRALGTALAEGRSSIHVDAGDVGPTGEGPGG